MACMRDVVLGSASPPISEVRGVRFRPTGMYLHGEAQPEANVACWLVAALVRMCAATLYVVGVCLNRIGTHSFWLCVWAIRVEIGADQLDWQV
jgi:hypothetical protein